MPAHGPGPAHGHGHDDDDHDHSHDHDAAAFADHLALEGEVLLAFVTATAAWITELRAAAAPPIRRVLDIGSGPGVGTCELARYFPKAHVSAVDSSAAMLARTAQRAAALGLGDRVSTHLAELPGGLDDVGSADLIWASMSLHHVGDEVNVLRRLGGQLDRHGLIAIAELADPTRVLPARLDVGRPGFHERLDAAGATWFAGMRAELADSVPSTDLPSMVETAGFEVVGTRLARERLEAPLSVDARAVVLGSLRRARRQFADLLDADDLITLDVLTDPDDRRSVGHRSDVFLEASRQIVIARPLSPAIP